MAEHPWRLDGRVALVTGASSGLGERFARVLSEAGAHVVVTARRRHLLEDLQSSCGDGIDVVPGDLADPRHRRALVTHVEATHGRLDIVVNNAGTADSGALEQQTMADLTRVIEVNLTSVLDLCRLAGPLLLAAPSASVVNV